MNRPSTRLLSLLAAASILASMLGTRPASAEPTVYLEEPFSDAPTTWAADWFDADIGPRNQVATLSDGSDGFGIKVSIPTNSHFGSAMHWQFADQGIPEPEELYFRYYLRVPDGFTNYGRGKLPGPAGLYSGSARNNIKPSDAQPGWSARMFFSPTYTDRDSSFTQLGFYVYHRDQESNNGDLILWDPQPGVLRHGAWYCVEGHVAMNTPGQPNGLLEGWVDEQLAFYQDDFKFRGSADGGIDIKSFWFDVYYGGDEKAPGNLSFDFDSLALSSERVGCGDTPIGSFRDTASSVHKTNITRLAIADITRGCNPPLNDLYCPEESVNRGQMAAFLVRALHLPATSTDYFSDDDDSIFQANINALAASGITKGCDTAAFCPDRSVTRGEMAAFLDRALSLSATTPDWFVDDDGSIFEASIDRLAGAGVTAGCNPPANTDFCPHSNVTRGEMASFLSRALSLPSPPPPPPGYVPPAIPAGFDAVVPVGWSIQEVTDSQPAGARIFLEAGTHQRQQVTPKEGQEFVGATGTVMDGLGETAFAFTGSVDNVTISGIEIKNYTSGFSQGAIHAEGTGWVISNTDVHDNAYVGVSIRGGSTISGSHIHHNDQLGILVDGGTGSLVAGNEIDNNNDDQTSGDYYFAGAKFLATKNLVVRNNTVHHNHGYGLWTHKDNIDTLYEGNVVESNYWAGISHDQSYTVTINNNEFRGNGTKAAAADKFYNGAIQITGPGATVTNNVIDRNHNAVAIIGYFLDDNFGLYGVLTPVDTTVTGNTVIDSGFMSLVTNGDTKIFDSALFNNNNYQEPSASADYWLWGVGSLKYWAEWQKLGNDTDGSFLAL